ncbi:MAG: peptidoglycan DD-metalloendopeptidase family protein [Sediminibacterium sp.]|jgi:murein hydrolase activator|nr:peptidoglycan DD-metalloendopeptidase family protein [Sediminibacterium sp.]
MFKKIILFVLLLIFANANVQAQANGSREDLQKEEQSIRKELDDLNRLLEQTKKNKKSSLGKWAVIRDKIRKREALINGIKKQVQILDNAIYTNQLDIQKLNKDLDTLKSRYAKSIIFAYKSRSGYEYLSFLFSANSFNDAVKRITYLKSYRQNRTAQAQAIDLSQKYLGVKIETLSSNKKDRLKTLNVQNDQLKVLVADRKEQDKVVKQLKSKEQEITAQVRQKEAQRKKMQQAILTIIRRETLEAKKKEKDRLAKLKANNDNTKAKPSIENKTATATGAKVSAGEGGLKSTTDNRPYSALETTEEGRETSVSFETNKGNLPWPVDKGYVYIHFGVESIPGTKLTRKSDGIELAAPKGTSVRSVANGKISYVGDVNGDLTIIIQHGKYFTMYTYLNNATVNVGQEVKAGTVLGKSGVNLDGEGAISFMIYNEKGVALDPESWLKNRR